MLGFKVVIKPQEHIKICRTCKRWLPRIYKFYKKHGKSGYRHSCRFCEKKIKAQSFLVITGDKANPTLSPLLKDTIMQHKKEI